MIKHLKSIDIMRCLAIIFMIQVHIYKFWIPYDDGFTSNIILFIGSLAAPLFLIVSGVSFYLFTSKNILENRKVNDIIIITLKRAVFIFCTTTLINILFGSYFGIKASFIIYWSVFQVIAFSIIIFLFIPFLNSKIRLIMYFSLILIIFSLYFLISVFNIEQLSLFINGSFEFLPWAIFFVIGIYFGDLLLKRSENENYHNIQILLFISFIFFIFWVFLFFLFPILNFTLFFLLRIWILLFVFLIFYYVSDLKDKENFLTREMVQWGKVSFSLYYIQFVLLLFGLILFPFILPQNFLGFSILFKFLMLLFSVIIIIIIILKIWRVFNYKYGFEWFMNLFTKKTLFNKEETNS